jgi:hypothetical protein
MRKRKRQKQQPPAKQPPPSSPPIAPSPTPPVLPAAPAAAAEPVPAEPVPHLFDFFKHLSVLSAAAVAFTATLLKNETHPFQTKLLQLGLLFFIASLMFALMNMVGLVRHPVLKNSPHGVSNPQFLVSLLAFFAGIFTLLCFLWVANDETVRNEKAPDSKTPAGAKK